MGLGHHNTYWLENWPRRDAWARGENKLGLIWVKREIVSLLSLKIMVNCAF